MSKHSLHSLVFERRSNCTRPSDSDNFKSLPLKTHSCMFFPYCTWNHAITCTNKLHFTTLSNVCISCVEQFEVKQLKIQNTASGFISQINSELKITRRSLTTTPTASKFLYFAKQRMRWLKNWRVVFRRRRDFCQVHGVVCFL